ncbi:ATP-dependent DNA ligase [Arthrobacter psychrolactophilus]|uniref:DNA ligase (ATP) n=1 Tax=Arthrobacter psychrolactophilus TaxID=92442 RepID=A0A2V5IKS5_9MICC|nr:ATP-dependent DNA ligase [Arthrobacter psychrolactophilus]PYI37268.1 ATP-dependent DNA ligase [Arthrobacter psychrolactophilus]
MVEVAGRRLKVSNLDKVLYPETGTTKADVLEYLAGVAHVLIPQAAWRPATRKRWVNGVGTAEKPGQVFFRKNLEDSAPGWVPRQALTHKDHVNHYPLVNEPAVLAWFGQVAALEIHVPQWRFGSDGKPANPDRLVLDLDPGEGAGLPECAETAQLCRELLSGMDLEAFPVTSGSKGIHLYVPLDGSHSAADVSQVAHELAMSLEADHPDLVVSDMKKTLRTGKVLVDWSQNSESKTTICPYSLRGRSRPTVAAPRTWDEIADPELRQLDYREVLARVKDGLDPAGALGWLEAANADRLEKYRSMRDAGKTPEPVPAEPARETQSAEPRFVIQEHHASRLHWDFRLEHSGVLVSWAVPKGPPLDSGENRLAVMTEDHPLSYGSFEGTIPKGQYGAGVVTIWDTGTCVLEKWREGREVIAVLHGRPDGGLGGVPRRYALISAPGMGDAKNWLIHLMKEQPEPDSRPGRGGKVAGPGSGIAETGVDHVKATTHTSGTSTSRTGETALARPSRKKAAATIWDGTSAELPAAMLATAGTRKDLDPEKSWSHEMKWDGMRAIAGVVGGKVLLASRNGNDVTAQYPELQELAALAADGSVFDGEIVALNAAGRPDFGLLQTRMKLTAKRDIEKAVGKVPVQLMLFDALQRGADSGAGAAAQTLHQEPYSKRREALFAGVAEGQHIHVPPAHTGNLNEALATSRELGLEGVVAKRTDGRYLPGKRSPGWLKIKDEHHQEVIVIGWRKGLGRRDGTLGSLLLAVNDGGRLRYVGRCGSGFSDSELQDAAERLGKITRKTSPVQGIPAAERRDVVWTTPKLVGEVSFTQATKDGRLRHPIWRGWRPDKSAADVQWEAADVQWDA